MKYFPFFTLLLIAFSCNNGANKVQNKLGSYFVTVKPEPFADLPAVCDESSGLEYLNGTIYTHNDSGGKDVLYIIDKKGKLNRELKLKDAKNIDWEDVAYGNNHFYVGDFGNNLGNRKDLTIYRLEEMNGDKADTKTITFRYGNQEDFSIKNRANSFDCESLLAFKDELVLFSKDWVNFHTQVYHLPINTEEEQVLTPTEEMNIEALITGADYDAKSETLVLCGYYNYVNYLWVFHGATQNKFLTENYTRIELDGLVNAQVEGLTLLDSNTILFSTEETKAFEEQMWTVDISKY